MGFIWGGIPALSLFVRSIPSQHIHLPILTRCNVLGGVRQRLTISSTFNVIESSWSFSRFHRVMHSVLTARMLLNIREAVAVEVAEVEAIFDFTMEWRL
ncbi:hypothetical protein M422DRAFT_37252, partial [Sphaerobolus stellatus SS14]